MGRRKCSTVRPADHPWGAFLRALADDLSTALARVRLQLAFTASEASERCTRSGSRSSARRHAPPPAGVGDDGGERARGGPAQLGRSSPA
jgi:hypothetical protein